MAVAHLPVCALRSRALCWLQAEEDGRSALDRDTQFPEPLCAMQGPPGNRSLSQAVSAAVATRFNKFSKVTYSQLNDYRHEIWKSLLVYLGLSSL